MPENISPEVYSKILEIDFRNLLKKVADGKTLSPAEHARVVSKAAGAADGIRAVRSVGELAEMLGTNRRQIARWRHMPGAPEPIGGGGHDVIAWREFVRSRNLKASGVGRGVDWDALKARKALAEIEDRELRVSIRKRQHVPLPEVEEFISTMAAKLSQAFRSKFEMELPPVLAGRDAVTIQIECSRALDDVLTTVPELPWK